MSKFFKVDSCNECPYHEQLWTGEYAKTERIYFCAYSPIQFLIPNEGKHKIHEDCELGDVADVDQYDIDDIDMIKRAYA